MKLQFFLLLYIAIFANGAAQAKEPFNIKGVQIGDTMESLKKVFSEIEIKSMENIAHCKSGHIVIQNGSTFTAFKALDDQKYSFKLIYVNGVQVVIKAEFSYVSSSVSRELFLARVKEKYDVTVINKDNIQEAKHSMADYAGISHFIVPEGHFFKINSNDTLRLKYISSISNHVYVGGLTHTIIIESKKFNTLDKNQRALGKKEKVHKERECGKRELKEIDF